MNFLTKYTLLLTFLCVFPTFVAAQGVVTEPAPLPPKRLQCTAELFNRAEYTYGWKGFRSNEIFAERYIRKILDVCPNAHLMPYLKERLAILEEIKAERNYSVGKFYLKR